MKSCKEKVVTPVLAGVISYSAATVALYSPIANAAGADVKNVASISTLNISFTFLVLVLVWFVSGLIGTMEKHDGPVICFVNSFGIPGIVLAFMAGSKLVL